MPPQSVNILELYLYLHMVKVYISTGEMFLSLLVFFGEICQSGWKMKDAFEQSLITTISDRYWVH